VGSCAPRRGSPRPSARRRASTTSPATSAGELLTRHRIELDSLAGRLLEEETVDGSVVYDLLLHPDGADDRPQMVYGK
jgi:hypothetical protein